MRDLRKSLKEEKIQSLRLHTPFCVEAGTPIGNVLKEMAGRRIGHAIVIKEKKVIGIFTERDALTRMVEQKIGSGTPVDSLMTPDPKVLKKDDSVAEAIRLMSQGGYRHLPILNEREEIAGIVSVRDILQYLADHFPYEVYNLPPDPQIIRAPEGA